VISVVWALSTYVWLAREVPSTSFSSPIWDTGLAVRKCLSYKREVVH
jgi:hypothetical protein